MKERLQKLIAQAGIASRRDAEKIILEGRVMLNGEIATLGQKADPEVDQIVIDGDILPKREKLVYLIFNKPRGVLTVMEGQPDSDLKSLADFVDTDKLKARVYPVGRLDVNSEGLVLLTNDGDLTNKITHPRYGHEKTYKVVLEGQINEEKLNRWRRGGIAFPDGFRTSPCQVIVMEQNRDETTLRVIMGEGHKRQIRTIAEIFGHNVRRLVRTHIGAIALGDLPPAQWRLLTPEEIEKLKTGVGSKARPRSPRPYRRNP